MSYATGDYFLQIKDFVSLQMISRRGEIKAGKKKQNKTEKRSDEQSNFKRQVLTRAVTLPQQEELLSTFIFCGIQFSLTSSSISSTTEGDPFNN